ncbi:MAG: cyclic nucleotide-binding domain-containing protein [Polyangiaceae bacterium]
MTVNDSIRFYAATDVGKVRDHNEDNFLVDKKLSLFVVADGITVHEEVRREKELIDDYLAGRTGANKVTTKDVVALLEHAVQRACSKIHQESTKDPDKRGMGTTLSALLLVGQQGFIAHVGDSRIYLSRGGRTQQVTEDHTVYNELIKRGKLTREQIEKVQQKNAITRAVGVYERVEVDTLVIELIAGDTLVLASDGLHGYLESPDELKGPLLLDGDASVKALVQLANTRGGKDNITTIVVRVGEEGAVDAAQAKRLALKRDVLANMPLFARLTERELLRVMQAVQVREFRDGELVIREGDRGDELFIVLEGKVRVSRGDQTLLELGQGEHVGEMALIRSVPRSASVTAVGAAELIAIRRADFFEILRKEHEVAVKMLWQFLGVLADRLDQTSSELHEMKRELAAEDVTAEIFPEVEVDAMPAATPSLSR